MQYAKPPLSTQEHIEQLQRQGLVIANEAKAAQYLNNIGYYRLSAYFIPFEQWQQHLAAHVQSVSHEHQRAMGFVENWRESNFWLKGLV